MKLLTKFNLILIALFAAGSLVIAFTAYRFLTRNARNQVIQQAELMIESARSTRQYTANELAPLLETVPAYKTRFLPETIPSTQPRSRSTICGSSTRIIPTKRRR
jgi:protein-histidine pros-kinase